MEGFRVQGDEFFELDVLDAEGFDEEGEDALVRKVLVAVRAGGRVVWVREANEQRRILCDMIVSGYIWICIKKARTLCSTLQT